MWILTFVPLNSKYPNSEQKSFQSKEIFLQSEAIPLKIVWKPDTFTHTLHVLYHCQKHVQGETDCHVLSYSTVHVRRFPLRLNHEEGTQVVRYLLPVEQVEWPKNHQFQAVPFTHHNVNDVTKIIKGQLLLCTMKSHIKLCNQMIKMKETILDYLHEWIILKSKIILLIIFCSTAVKNLCFTKVKKIVFISNNASFHLFAWCNTNCIPKTLYNADL